METASSAALLLLNLPEGALGGIDLLSFTTSPRFQGIKNIPRGIHFAFAGATSSLSLRHGIWFQVASLSSTSSTPDLWIKKWDPSTESLVPELSDAETLRHRANIGSIWRDRLTPYRQSASKDATADEPTPESVAWTRLSDHITSTSLARILGPHPNDWSLNSSSFAAADQDDIAHLSTSPTSLTERDKNLNFFPIDLRRTWPAGSTGSQRTLHARDKSWYLTSLLTTHDTTSSPHSPEPVIESHTFEQQQQSLALTKPEPDDTYSGFLAELQFTFLMVLTLNNYSSLAQWRRLVTLCLGCKSLIRTRPTVFATIMEILDGQMRYLCSSSGEDTHSNKVLFEFDDSRTGRDWLVGLMTGFLVGLGDVREEIDADLGTKMSDAYVESQTRVRAQVRIVQDMTLQLIETLGAGMEWDVSDLTTQIESIDASLRPQTAIVNGTGANAMTTTIDGSHEETRSRDTGTDAGTGIHDDPTLFRTKLSGPSFAVDRSGTTTGTRTSMTASTKSTPTTTVMRMGTLQLEDGETVEMDFGTTDDYDREHEEGEYAPVIVDLS